MNLPSFDQQTKEIIQSLLYSLSDSRKIEISFNKMCLRSSTWTSHIATWESPLTEASCSPDGEYFIQ